MNAHDDTFLDSVAVLALGALPEAEAREVAAHVATCDTCRLEYDALRDAANLVGFGAEVGAGGLDELTAARMKSAVMRAVRATLAPATPLRATPARATQNGATRSWLAYGAAAAAIVIALLTSAHDSRLRSEHGRDQQRLAELEAGNALAIAMLAPGAKRFAGPGGDVVTSDGRVYLALRHLAPPPPGKVYQAWTFASGSKIPIPSSTFVPDAAGRSVIELPEHAAGLTAVAVTVEPIGGSQKPTSKPSFVRPLT